MHVACGLVLLVLHGILSATIVNPFVFWVCKHCSQEQSVYTTQLCSHNFFHCGLIVADMVMCNSVWFVQLCHVSHNFFFGSFAHSKKHFVYNLI